MNSLTKRLEKLEAAGGLNGGNPPMDIPLPEFMASIESKLELPAGTLPRTIEEATGRGFESMAAATRAALGMNNQEFKLFLETGEYQQ